MSTDTLAHCFIISSIDVTRIHKAGSESYLAAKDTKGNSLCLPYNPNIKWEVGDLCIQFDHGSRTTMQAKIIVDNCVT